MEYMDVINNKYSFLTVGLIVGGLIFHLLGPEKIITKKEIETQIVEKIVNKDVIQYVDKIQYKEVEKIVVVKKVTRKETFPDGRIVEEEIYESNEQQLDRLLENTKQKYEEQITQITSKYEQKLSEKKEIINPKKLTIYTGGGTLINNLKPYVLGGIMYDINTPWVIGGQVVTNNNDTSVFGTLGFKF